MRFCIAEAVQLAVFPYQIIGYGDPCRRDRGAKGTRVIGLKGVAEIYSGTKIANSNNFRVQVNKASPHDLLKIVR
jgi:hypothetical protein